MSGTETGTGTIKSFNELAEVFSAGKDERKFTRNPINTVKPVALRRLAEIVNNNIKTGEMLGISGSHVGQCLIEGQTRLSYELAAKAVLNDMEREPSRPLFYFVEVRNGQKEVIDAFLRGMNLKATVL
jgi:hypothetical protein